MRARIEFIVRFDLVPSHEVMGEFVQRITQAINTDDMRMGRPRMDPFIEVNVSTQEA